MPIMKNDASPIYLRALVRLIRTAVGSAVYAGLAFLGAGRLDWMRGWVYAGVFVAVSVIGTLIVQGTNPRVLEARAKGIRKDTKAFDKAFYLMFLPLVLLYPLLAGADAIRFSWAPLPWWTVTPGVLLFLLSSVFGTWTLVVNAHAETTVRIQDEHRVVTSGPYRFVRHPMYLGTVAGLPGTALMLGSGWALLPMALIIMLFVWRTAREDRALRQELAGYEDYARRTRYRLLPGIW
jgi:protein-S-isoprenylcysteine O-methyltransferase Ste14